MYRNVFLHLSQRKWIGHGLDGGMLLTGLSWMIFRDFWLGVYTFLLVMISVGILTWWLGSSRTIWSGWRRGVIQTSVVQAMDRNLFLGLGLFVLVYLALGNLILSYVLVSGGVAVNICVIGYYAIKSVKGG